MSRAVVPIARLSRRLPEAGRIRTGVKKPTGRGKERPAAIPEFRFTSHDEQALDQIAAMYGGTVRPWSDPKAAGGQFEVITEASEIRVVLPPDPLGGSPVYELWDGGGCERRCDGLTATILQQGPDGLEPTDAPCICVAKGEMACNVVTRLSVILPEVRFAGVWRLDTKSWNAAQELPGMVDLVQSMQDQGLTYASLTLKQRRSVAAGQTRNFIVPMLGIPQTVEELAAGHARLGALPEGTPSGALELAPGTSEGGEDREDPPGDQSPAPAAPAPSDSPVHDDDEIVDAEIVESPQVPPVPAGTSATESDACSLCGEPYGDAGLVRGDEGQSRYVHKACRDGASTDAMTESQRKHIFAELRSRKITGPERFKWATGILGREVTTFSELTEGDAERLIGDLRGAA